MTLKKGAFFTDIHFGKKANSNLHNEDCLRFINWFCEQVRNDPDIDYIGFLGDWNENRSALNIATLNHSYQGAKLLDQLDLPIYFVVGNHDLYHRHTREIHSVVPFNEFRNFVIIDEPTIIEEIEGRALFCPFLFPDEYPQLIQYIDIPFWAGHFEFQGYVVTGYDITMPTGPNAADYAGPDHIVSGHFHKRQVLDHVENVVYMGNAFPMDFGDAGDFNRGMMTFDHTKDKMEFIDWGDCPKYIKTTLSDLLDDTVTLHPQSRVRCTVDIPVNFEESTFLKQTYTEKFDLREFTLEEARELTDLLSETEFEVDLSELASVNELVVQMLNEIDSEHIDNQLLIDIYQEL